MFPPIINNIGRRSRECKENSQPNSNTRYNRGLLCNFKAKTNYAKQKRPHESSKVICKSYCKEHSSYSSLISKRLLITMTIVIITISQIDRGSAVPLSPLNAFVGSAKRASSIETLNDNNTLLRQQQQQQLFAMLTRNGHRMKDLSSAKFTSSGELNSNKQQHVEDKLDEIFNAKKIKAVNLTKKSISKTILANLALETSGFISDEALLPHSDAPFALTPDMATKNNKSNSYFLNGNKCPKQCKCLDNYFDCASQNLDHVPSLPEYVEVLDLVGNKLTDNSIGEIRNLSDLLKLDLKRNRLEAVPAMQGLPNLKHLSLANNRIQRISGEALSLLPNLKTLDLTGNMLHSIEADYFPTTNRLTHLLLDGNRISKVDENAFNYLTELLDLELNNNSLSVLPAGVFQNLNKLKQLSLNNNFLEIHWSTFKGLYSVQKLFLKSNNILALQHGIFHVMQSIETIELDNNGITSLSRQGLFNLTKLSHISLSNNSISHIELDTWEFTQSLKYLDLSFNNISEFKAQHLDCLKHLQRLDLGHNKIQYLMENTFDCVVNLENLSLRRNKLAWIIEDPSAAPPFKSLKKLKKLDLYGNNIKQITAKSLMGLSNLESLNLGGNALASIQSNTFENMPKLHKLIFKSINFICDCDLLWFRRWLPKHFRNSSSHQQKKLRKNAICGYPEHLLDQELLALTPAELVCSDSPKPVIMKEPSKYLGVVGENVTFECIAHSPAAASLAAADELKIIWRHDNQNFKTRYPFSRIVQETSSTLVSPSYIATDTQIQHEKDKNHTVISGFLRIYNVSYENAGKYQCVVSNAFGTTYSQKFKVSLGVPPKFSVLPSNLTVDSGDTARLVCAATGDPKPEIYLQKSGDTNFPAAMERRLRPVNDAFVITNSKPADTGIYSCIAVSPAGEIKVNASLFVNGKMFFYDLYETQ